MSDSGEAEVQTHAPTVDHPHAPPEVETSILDAPPEQPEVAAAKDEDQKKDAKETKQRTPRKKKAKAPAHPPYFQMIKEAVTGLNEKGGSSPYAIAKYMEENHKPVLPPNFRKILGLQLKNSVSKGKLIKIKASFKLSEVIKTKNKSSATTTRAARANAGAKPSKEVTKKRKRKLREVSKIENPPPPPSFPTVGATTRGRRSKRLKSIKSQVGKKAKKVIATA